MIRSPEDYDDGDGGLELIPSEATDREDAEILTHWSKQPFYDSDGELADLPSGPLIDDQTFPVPNFEVVAEESAASLAWSIPPPPLNFDREEPDLWIDDDPASQAVS
jgi:hypothetical protein